MRAEQPIKLCKLRRKMRVKVGAPYNWFKLPVIVSGFPKAALSLRFHLFLPGRVAQSVGHLTRNSEVLGSILGLATYFRFPFR